MAAALIVDQDPAGNHQNDDQYHQNNDDDHVAPIGRRVISQGLDLALFNSEIAGDGLAGNIIAGHHQRHAVRPGGQVMYRKLPIESALRGDLAVLGGRMNDLFLGTAISDRQIGRQCVSVHWGVVAGDQPQGQLTGFGHGLHRAKLQLGPLGVDIAALEHDAALIGHFLPNRRRGRGHIGF